MRAARNNDRNEGVDKGLYVALNTNTSANEVYDTTGMIMTPDGKFLVQSGITTPSADIVSFIQQHTGNTYSWGATTSPVATVDYNNMIESNFLNSRNSCLGECGAAYDVKTGKYMWVSANIMGQVATAGQFGGTIGMYEPHSALEDTKILAGTAAAATLAIFAPQVVIASPTAAAISAGTSGTVNAVTQYIKYGEILYPAELISSTVLGGVAGPLMANSNIYYNIGYGGSFATANSAFLNSYYTPEERVPDDLVNSFIFGGIGGGSGKLFDSFLVRTWTGNIPQYIRPQGYNPELGALLNPAPVINPVLGRSILIKDTLSGFTGTITETGTKEAWERVNAK